MTLEIDDAARDYIVKNGYDEKYGARPLKRTLQNKVEDELAEQILDGRLKAGNNVFISCNKNESGEEKLTFSVK